MKADSKLNLGKKEIVDMIKSIIGFSSQNLEKIVNDTLDSVTQTLIEHKKVNIKNFGTFYVTHKKEREGRNPKTNEEFIISSRNVIKFKPSNLLTKKINE